MPITISVKEFKKKTSTTFHTRPSQLRIVDVCLKNYHKQVSLNAPHSEIALDEVSSLLSFIQNWKAGKETVTINGQLRYKAYRDRHGMISELERQATQTKQEIKRVHHGLIAHLTVNVGIRNSIDRPPPPPPGKAPLPFVYFGKDTPPPLPPKPKLPLPLRDSTESFDSSDFRPVSLDTFICWDKRSITNPRISYGAREDNMENMGLVNRALQEDVAYQTAADMILIATQQPVQHAQVMAAAQQPKILTGGVLTMGSLFSAMNSIVENTGKHIYYERHCTQAEYFANTLHNASVQNPVLFAVTDNANRPSKVIICRGKRLMFDGQRQWYRYDMIDHYLGIGVANMTMDDQGDLTVESNGQIAHYVAARELGFIKLKLRP